ncbi:MAG: hypothetical protein ACLTSZ_17695 [Lachnospiraceae bacterium]
MKDAISAPKVGGIVRLTRFILKGTMLIEAAGAVLLLPVFLSDYGLKGIWMSVFHSVSAFCNAGFDILGTADNAFPSLIGYSGNVLIKCGNYAADHHRGNRFSSHWDGCLS